MKTKTTKTMKMTQVLAMWKKTTKENNPYFNGKMEDGTKLVGFYNTYKKNPKEPDVRIYNVGDFKEPILSLWVNVSKRNTKYLTGKYNDKRVVGFINDDPEGNKPYFSVFYSEEL